MQQNTVIYMIEDVEHAIWRSNMKQARKEIFGAFRTTKFRQVTIYIKIVMLNMRHHI